MNGVNKMVRRKTKKSLDSAKNVWVSGTSVSNYLLKDPVIDWLKLYYNTHGLNNSRITRSKTKLCQPSNNGTTVNVLMKNGCHFEQKIYADLYKRFGGNVVNLDASHNLTNSEKNIAFTRTLEAMKNKIPIIIQAYVKSDTLKLEGVTDILVRNDYLDKLVRRRNFNISSAPHHYVVVDVKWSHMTLCVDGKTIRNEGRFKAYKGQLFIYNIILGELQGYTPSCSYVMPKSWNIDKKGFEQSGASCYDLVGVVDYSDRDAVYIDETVKAINWVRDVRTYGCGWSPLTPHITELCCNSCNQDDTWSSVKKTIMKETKDITQVWMVTPDHRNEVFVKGIKSWDDTRCDVNLFGLGDGSKLRTINEILAINRSTSSKIKLNSVDNRYGWKNKIDGVRDLYIDYETISEAFIEHTDMDIDNGKLSDGYIFMIGVGYENNGEFVHTSFACTEYTQSEEHRIITELKDFLSNLQGSCPSQRLFHWGHVEKTLMDAALLRHPDISWDNYNLLQWVDMCSVFTKAPIVVKGSLTFKLKDIANAMLENGLITTKWESGALENGLVAMQRSIDYYSSGCPHGMGWIMDGVKEYNMIDCKVLWDIVRYLRSVV